MVDCGITTYILATIWFFFFLLILTAFNTGHSSSGITIIVATTLTICIRLVPEDTLREIVHNFYRNVYLQYPVTVMSTIISLFIAYVYFYNYISAYEPEDPPPNLKGPGETD